MIAMSLTEMTFDDLMLLEQFRNQRLRNFFAQSLLPCTLRRSHHKTLIIHCPEAWIVDNLLTESEELCNYAWLILGVEAIALYFLQKEIYRVEYCKTPSAIHTCFE
jgi:hypothetical protein